MQNRIAPSRNLPGRTHAATPADVASSPLPGGPRHVGRVIDPSVREDGEPEPSLELAGDVPPPAQAEEREPAGPSEPATLTRGNSLRERLLERASQAQHAQEHDSDSLFADLDQIGRSEADRPLESDVGTPGVRAPSAPLAFQRRGRLSPNQQALFTTLLGVATVASLIALASNLDVGSPSAPTTVVAPSATPASSATPQSALPPARPKRVREKLPGPWRIEDAKGEARMRILEGQVKTDAFLVALDKVGVEQRERYRILTSLKGVRDFDRCKKSDRFRVLLEHGSPRVKAFEYIVGPAEVYQSREGADGLLKGSKLDLKVTHNQVSGALVFDGESFDASGERSGFDSGLRKVVAKALDGHLDMSDLSRGDRVRLLAQEMTVLGEFGGYTGIEAIEVRPADSTRAALRVYYFDKAGERGYYDADGRSPYEGGWRKPVKNAPVTSPFNLKRMHPVLKKVTPHLGIDFGAPTGTPVGASSSGTVSFIGYAGPAGNLVKIEHSGGIATGYAHLSRFAEGLKVGDHVKRLQVVGYVGSTGRSTGPHLHFTASRKGEFFDPVTLKLDAMRVVSKEGREIFAQMRAKYDAQLDALPLPDALPALAPKEPTPSTGSIVAAAPPVASPPTSGMDVDDDEDGEQPAPPAIPAAPTKSVVHLTDKELLELSGVSDEGEIAE